MTVMLAWSGSARAQDPFEEQPLSLEAALAEARRGNAALFVARAGRAIAEAGALEASAFLWPRLSTTYEVLRSTDPVFAFGAKLRQGIFTEADLALDALNDPGAVEDWAAGADLSWAALDPRSWARRSAARSEAEAAAWRSLRARQATDLQTQTLYWNAVRAVARRLATEAAEAAARSTLDLFQSRQERGLLTDADRLQAEAELAASRADRIDGERAEREARRALGVFLGWETNVLPAPSDTLEPPRALPREPFDPAVRSDIRGLTAALEAREAELREASYALLPAVDAFGRYRAHAGSGFEFDEDDWTLGVALRWTAFDGFSREAGRLRAAHAVDIARVQRAQGLREAGAEVLITEDAVQAAALRAEAALAARRAAERAVILVRRRFEEGLATPNDLLQAEARKTAMEARAIDALAGWRIAQARAEFSRSPSDAEDLP